MPGFSQPALQYFETSPEARLSVRVFQMMALVCFFFRSPSDWSLHLWVLPHGSGSLHATIAP